MSHDLEHFLSLRERMQSDLSDLSLPSLPENSNRRETIVPTSRTALERITAPAHLKPGPGANYRACSPEARP